MRLLRVAGIRGRGVVNWPCRIVPHPEFGYSRHQISLGTDRRREGRKPGGYVVDVAADHVRLMPQEGADIGVDRRDEIPGCLRDRLAMHADAPIESPHERGLMVPAAIVAGRHLFLVPHQVHIEGVVAIPFVQSPQQPGQPVVDLNVGLGIHQPDRARVSIGLVTRRVV